jgi:hypothetical protein
VSGGNAAIEAVYAGNQHFYVMPLFNYVGFDTDTDGINDDVDEDDDGDGVFDQNDSCPLNPQPDPLPSCASITGDDVITANGKEWAQRSLFNALAAADIMAVCPFQQGYICKTGKTLNGHDMTGWIWANRSAIRSLFNFYGANIPSYNTSWVLDETGWKSAYSAAGWLGPLQGYEAFGGSFIDYYYTSVTTNAAGLDYYQASLITGAFNGPVAGGGWFYRTPQ